MHVLALYDAIAFAKIARCWVAEKPQINFENQSDKLGNCTLTKAHREFVRLAIYQIPERPLIHDAVSNKIYIVIFTLKK